MRTCVYGIDPVSVLAGFCGHQCVYWTAVMGETAGALKARHKSMAYTGRASISGQRFSSGSCRGESLITNKRRKRRGNLLARLTEIDRELGEARANVGARGEFGDV
jgi:hypothetical protein